MTEALTNIVAGLSPDTARIAGIWVAALLTCAVLSYILGENPVFRAAEYILVGTAAGYAASMAWNAVLLPRLRLLLADPATYWYYGLFFALGLLLLCRGIKSVSVLGEVPLGVLFGVGAALALGGALAGSLIPQMRAGIVSVSPASYGGGQAGLRQALDALLLTAGTIAVFSAFHFTRAEGGRLGIVWSWLLRIVGSTGRGLIMVTFGAVLAGAMFSFLALLQSRLLFLLNDWLKLGL